MQPVFADWQTLAEREPSTTSPAAAFCFVLACGKHAKHGYLPVSHCCDANDKKEMYCSPLRTSIICLFLVFKVVYVVSGQRDQSNFRRRGGQWDQ